MKRNSNVMYGLNNNNDDNRSIGFYQIIKDETRRFCSKTGLHGFPFITLKDTSSTERFVWTFISFGALMLALILITLSWFNNLAHLTYIATDSMQHPISSFTYPAISFCSLNKISKRKAIRFIRDTLKETDIDYWMNQFRFLAQMFFVNENVGDISDFRELQDLFDKRNISVEDVLVQVTPSCTELLQNCIWKGISARCDGMFQDTRTPEGMCCTFNHYAFKNRIFQGFQPERYGSKPRKVAGCGEQSGLKVLLKTEPDDYLISEFSAYGTKVLLHDPVVYPDWGVQNMIIPMTTLMYLDISPQKTYVTPEILAMSFNKRRCFFRDERKLKIFQQYTYVNCMTECRIDIIGKICKCMPFFFRNEWHDWTPNLPMCTLRDMHCLAINKPRFMIAVPGYDVYQTKKSDHIWGVETSECDCPLDCVDSQYDISSTESKLSTGIPVNEKQFYGVDSGSLENYSAISIFFTDLTGIRNKRDVTLPWSSLFGLFGGLLGICLGFSFIAFLDAVYGFTIRLGLTYYDKKKNNSKICDEPKEKIMYSNYSNRFDANELPSIYNSNRTPVYPMYLSHNNIKYRN